MLTLLLSARQTDDAQCRMEDRIPLLHSKSKGRDPFSSLLAGWPIGEAEDGTWSATDEELATAKEFSERVLADASVEIPTAVVMDVGIMANGNWAVIESNAAFSSGMYGCDAEKVLPLLLHACWAN